MIKKILGTLLAPVIFIHPLGAAFDSNLIDTVRKDRGISSYQADIRETVRVIDLLAKRLSTESNATTVQNLKDTIFLGINKGEGLGGIIDPAKDPNAYATAAEQRIFAFALAKIQERGGVSTTQSGNVGASKLKYLEDHQAQVNNIIKICKVQHNSNQGQFLAAVKSNKDSKGISDHLINLVWQVRNEGPPNIYGANIDNLGILTTELRTTTDFGKANTLANNIKSAIKTIDFSKITNTDANNPTLDSLIALVKYQGLEVNSGTLKTTNPTIFEFVQEYSMPDKSQAILLAYISAMQDYFYNPKATVEDLINLFRFKKNSRLLKIQSVATAATNLIKNGEVKNIINQELIGRFNNINLKINEVQRQQIDAITSRQAKIKYPGDPNMHHFKSDGTGMQCGFFSLGYESREDAINAILDNLFEPEILRIVGTITSIPASIMANFDTKNKTTIKADLNQLLAIYNKKPDSKPNTLLPKLKLFMVEYNALDTKLQSEYYAELRNNGITPDKVTSEQGELASELKRPYELKKLAKSAELLNLVYPLADLQQVVRAEITKKFLNGLLEFDPNPDACLETFPGILAILNNYNIYAWVNQGALNLIQRSQYAIIPIKKTNDQLYSLVNLIKISDSSKDVNLVNFGNNHFEKWINSSDYPQLARAIRHKQKYNLPNTN